MIDVNAVPPLGRWNAEFRIRRTLSDDAAVDRYAGGGRNGNAGRPAAFRVCGRRHPLLTRGIAGRLVAAGSLCSLITSATSRRSDTVAWPLPRCGRGEEQTCFWPGSSRAR